MLKSLGISAPTVESCPLFYDAAVDNAKDGGTAEDPEGGDEVVLGNGFYDRHVEVGKGLEFPARPTLIDIERAIVVDAVVTEVGRVYLRRDLGATLIENLLD